MLVVTHEGRFLGCDNVVFAFRDTHVIRAMRRHLHNNDPRTFVRRDASRVDQYNLVRPEVPRAPLDLSKVNVESRGVGFMWRLITAKCELFVVIEFDEDEGAMRGVHAELPGRGDRDLTVKNLTSLFEHGKGVFCEDT